MLIEDLARTASAGKQTDIILLDFSKPFDKVNHSKLFMIYLFVLDDSLTS